MLEFPEGKKLFKLFCSNCDWWIGKTKTPELIKSIKEEFASRTENDSIESYVYFWGKYFDVPELMWFDSEDSPKVKMFYCKFLTRFCGNAFQRLIKKGQIDPLKIIETTNWLMSDEYEAEAKLLYNPSFTRRISLDFLSSLIQYCEVPSNLEDLTAYLKKILFPIFIREYMVNTLKINSNQLEIIKKVILDCREKYGYSAEKQVEINEAIESLYSEYKIYNNISWKYKVQSMAWTNKELLVALVPRKNGILMVDFDLLFDFIKESHITVEDQRYQQIIDRYSKEAELAREQQNEDLAQCLSGVVQSLKDARDQELLARPTNRTN